MSWNDWGLSNWLRNLSIKLSSIVIGLHAYFARLTKLYSCRAILYVFSRSCIACPALPRTLSRPDESRISAATSTSPALSSASLRVAKVHDRLRYARSSSPANAARFYAMPSVTIVVELSHMLDLMDSRRLLRPRPWSLLEISSSSYPRNATALAYNICPLFRRIQWGRLRGTSQVEKEASYRNLRFQSSRESLDNAFDLLGLCTSRFRIMMLYQETKENLIINFTIYTVIWQFLNFVYWLKYKKYGGTKLSFRDR